MAERVFWAYRGSELPQDFDFQRVVCKLEPKEEKERVAAFPRGNAAPYKDFSILGRLGFIRSSVQLLLVRNAIWRKRRDRLHTYKRLAERKYDTRSRPDSNRAAGLHPKNDAHGNRVVWGPPEFSRCRSDLSLSLVCVLDYEVTSSGVQPCQWSPLDHEVVAQRSMTAWQFGT